MEKSIYIEKSLYKYINSIAKENTNEQMMLFGGTTIGDTVIINSRSFAHLKQENLVDNDNDSVEISLKELKKYIILNKELGNDTFIMTHSHPCKSDLFEFMFGDLSDEDEINSAKIRELCSACELDYIDGITTGRRLYFWSTHNKDKSPKLLNCYVDNNKIDYNNLTQITENMEHIFR